MKRNVLLILFSSCLVLLNTSINKTWAQKYITSGATFKPYSFQELAAPLMMANAVYNEAQKQISEYVIKINECFDNENYESALTYLNLTESINNRFNKRFINEQYILQAKMVCKEKIERKKAISEINNLYQRALSLLRDNNYGAAKSLIYRCEEINQNHKNELVDQNFFMELKESIEQQEIYYTLNNQILDINDLCIYVTGAGKPVKKSIQYQTTGLNNSCRIKKITTTSKETIIELTYTNHYDENGWCSISPYTRIIDKRTGNEYTLLYANGIPLSPGKHQFSNTGDSITFKLVFPSLPNSTYYIDLIEEDGGPWRFFNIKIR